MLQSAGPVAKSRYVKARKDIHKTLGAMFIGILVMFEFLVWLEIKMLKLSRGKSWPSQPMLMVVLVISVCGPRQSK